MLLKEIKEFHPEIRIIWETPHNEEKIAQHRANNIVKMAHAENSWGREGKGYNGLHMINQKKLSDLVLH